MGEQERINDKRRIYVHMSPGDDGWAREREKKENLLSVRVAPFVGFLPLFDGIASQLRVKYVGIGRAHDFLTAHRTTFFVSDRF